MAKKKDPKERKEKKPRVKSSAEYDGTLFSFVKMFFGNNPNYEKLTQYDKGRHRFMIQRFMSIQYPIMANKLNINKTNPAHIVSSWKTVASRYNTTPKWIWTKVEKGEKVNNKKIDIDPEVLKFYLNKYQISKRDFKEALKFNPDQVLNEIQSIEKQIKADG
jgi:hypothetical protein